MTKTVKTQAQDRLGATQKMGSKTKRKPKPKPKPKRTAASQRPEDADIGDTAEAIADGGDHARLLIVNGVVFGLGLVTRNAKLTRTGVRMVIAQGLAFGARTLFSQGVHAQGEETAEEASQHGAKSARRDDDEGVATGSGAATVAVARAVSATTPIPYIPARLAGLAITGRNTPRKANAISDFLMGAAIGWLAERLAKRLVGGDDEDRDVEG